MDDRRCVEFLQWALPRLGMRWPGFRKVRGQVCKRLRRRLGELGLADLDSYREFLEGHPDEWARLESLTHITISRFLRDRGMFDFLLAEVAPALAARALARGDECVRAWSAGCASGEEAYSLSILWRLGLDTPVRLRILATDVDETMLERARRSSPRTTCPPPPGACRGGRARARLRRPTPQPIASQQPAVYPSRSR